MKIISAIVGMWIILLRCCPYCPSPPPPTPGTWVATGNLATARTGHTATAMAIGSVLVAGGATAPAGGGSIASAETFSPQSGIWTIVGSMAAARAYHTATEFSAPNTKVLVAGGAGPHGEYLSSAEVYDEGARIWSSTGSMNTGRGYHAAIVLLTGKILVVGGLTGNNGMPTATAELWDPATGTWTSTGSLTTARAGHTATLVLGGQVMVAGGFNRSGPVGTAEIYDPTTGTWTSTGSLTFPRSSHTATSFLVGSAQRVLVTGGSGMAGPLSSCEVWDSSTGKWTVTGSLATPRTGHTATLASPGAYGAPTQVLVVGGTNSVGYLTSAEVYDIPSGNWSYTSSLPPNAQGRYGHTATVISAPPLLEILVAGGANIIGGANNDAYIYNPASIQPVANSFTDVKPATGRGGRMVAVSISSANSQIAITAGESGGLFKTMDAGQTWAHVDSFAPFRMADVEFVPAGFANPNIVVATTTADANPSSVANNGGIWTSDDGGVSWTHVVMPNSCPSWDSSAYGIAFLAPSSVYVAASCGLLANTQIGASNWAQAGNWSSLRAGPLMSVAAQRAAGSVILDICQQGGGQARSTNGGNTWGTVASGTITPNCESPHSIAQSPLESNVIFATYSGTVIESDNAGGSWLSLKAGSYSGRPHFVRVHMSPDQNPVHFDLYYSGREVTCSNVPDPTTGLRCPSDTGGSNSPWKFLPTNSLNHDINEIAFDPSSTNCAMYEAGDFGLFKIGPPVAGTTCGDPAAWSIAGNAGAGMDGLQLYDLAGQVQYPIVGLGSSGTPFTNIFFGTQDNGLQVTFNIGSSGWQCFGASGFCDPEGSFLQVAPQSQSATQITLDSLDVGTIAQASLNETTGVLGPESAFTGVTPPGDSSIPLVVALNTYVAWSGSTLYLTQDNGQSWVPIATVPSNIGPIFPGVHQMELSSAPNGPALVEAVGSTTGAQGIILLTGFLPPPSQPIAFSIQTLGGTNSKNQPSGLQAIWGNCFGQGAWYCAGVYAVDPNDYHHLYAVDGSAQVVSYSLDAGLTWKEDTNLTQLIGASGVPMTDSIFNSQVHAIAFDPRNSSHILVGTDQAGIFASANGGASWRALPNTTKATAITSFYFDDRTRSLYVGTYGRGLWKLMLDWSSVH